MALVPVGAFLLLAAQPPASTLAPPLIEQRETPAPELPGAQERQPKVSTQNLVTVNAAEAGALIKGIEFIGVKAPARVADAARPFLDKPASRETLKALANAISEAYAKSDIALYTVAIPDQDLSTGKVSVLLAEGFVEDIVYPQGASPLIRAYAERLRKEQPLTRRGLERYLSLMRDIPGAKVDVALLRGEKAGGVTLSITPVRDASDFSFGVDNRKQAGLGAGQFRATGQLNSLLRDGDRTDLTLLSAIDLKRYRYAGLSHQTPIGSDGLTLALSTSYLDTRLKYLPIEGQAWTAGISVNYPLIRSYKRNLTISAGLDGLNSDAALLGSVLSSDHIRSLRFAMAYSLIGKKSVLAASAALSQGIDIIGARGTPGFTDPSYTKVIARASYDHMLGKHFVGRVRAAGQYSRDRLSGNERFAIGGPDFGRAFDTAILSGDKGAAASLEMAWRPWLAGKFVGTEVYGFIDGARIRVLERVGNPATTYDLASAGGGVRLAYTSRAAISVEGARVIDSAYAGAEGGWAVNLGWQLKLRR